MLNRTSFALMLGLAVTGLVMGQSPALAQEGGIRFGQHDSYIDVPYDYEQVARDYVVEELGFVPAAIGDIQLLAIRRNSVEDIVERVQAIVRFKQQPGSVVVVMRRSGSVITHFEQE